MTRREYRLHRYTIKQYRDPTPRGAGSAASASASSLSRVAGAPAPTPGYGQVNPDPNPNPNPDPNRNPDQGVAGAPSPAPLGATTSIALAFPVSAELTPQRSAHGELVFAYLPVTGAGLPFALHADFELVASRQEVSMAIVSRSYCHSKCCHSKYSNAPPPTPTLTLAPTPIPTPTLTLAPTPTLTLAPTPDEVSDSNSANRVLLARVPKLFVHAVLTDPGEGGRARIRVRMGPNPSPNPNPNPNPSPNPNPDQRWARTPSPRTCPTWRPCAGSLSWRT